MTSVEEILQALLPLVAVLSIITWAERFFNITCYWGIRFASYLEHGSSSSQPPWGNGPAAPAVTTGSTNQPTVAVQLPMCNEPLCCGAIDSCCRLNWPKDKLIIQVLDDSTDASIQQMIDHRVLYWKTQGINIYCIRRNDRTGFKAGNLKNGLQQLKVFHKDCEYVAIFDADFRPCTDFLANTVPHLEDNHKLAFVQARWSFSNAENSILTKSQQLMLNYCENCEDYVSSVMGRFFFFTGTAAVWRISSIHDYGGWRSDTINEDLDISLRAYMKGRKALCLNTVFCSSQLVDSFDAYTRQQQRWTTGHVQLCRRYMPLIAHSPQLSVWRKAEVLFVFMFIRKMLKDLFVYGFFPICFMAPLTLFGATSGTTVPRWLVLHLPLLASHVTVSVTPGGWLWALPNILVTNSMGFKKLRSIAAGFQRQKNTSDETWVTSGSSRGRKAGNLVTAELLMALWLIGSGLYGINEDNGQFALSIWVLLHGIGFMWHYAQEKGAHIANVAKSTRYELKKQFQQFSSSGFPSVLTPTQMYVVQE